jgi:hypothetical protein
MNSMKLHFLNTPIRLIVFVVMLTLPSIEVKARACDRAPSINQISSGCTVTGLVSYYGTYNSETNTYNQGPFYFVWYRSTNGTTFQSVYGEYGIDDGEGGVSSTYNGSISHNEIYYVVVTDYSCGDASSVHLTINNSTVLVSGVAYSCSPGLANIKLSGAPAGSTYYLYINGVQQAGANQSGNYSITYNANDVIEGAAYTGACLTPRTPISVVNEQLGNVAVTGNIVCQPGQFTLSATNYQAGYFLWYRNGTEIPNQHGAQLIGNTADGMNYSVAVRITEYGTCISPITNINLQLENIPAVDAGADLNICKNVSPITLSGVTPAGGVWSGTGVNGASFNPAIAGLGTFQLTYTFTTSNGCSKSDTRTVSVNDIPTATISQSPGTVDGEAMLSANESAEYEYKWRWNGSLIPGANLKTYKATRSGEYYVVVSYQGCSSSSNSIDVVVNDENFIIVNSIQISGVKSEQAIASLTPGNKELHQSIVYYDGIGRPKQSVVTKGSPAENDIVQPISYDDYGRDGIKYLPYESSETDGWYKSNAIATSTGYEQSDQYQFYTNPQNDVPYSTMPYAETKFEASPISRVTKQGAPGEVWQPQQGSSEDRSIKRQYASNKEMEVIKFTYNPATESIESNPIVYYHVDRLHAYTTLDEHNNEQTEFVDLDGKLIMKRMKFTKESGQAEYACTYYVYDDFGNIVFVLPPDAVLKLTGK